MKRAHEDLKGLGSYHFSIKKREINNQKNQSITKVTTTNTKECLSENNKRKSCDVNVCFFHESTEAPHYRVNIASEKKTQEAILTIHKKPWSKLLRLYLKIRQEMD